MKPHRTATITAAATSVLALLAAPMLTGAAGAAAHAATEPARAPADGGITHAENDRVPEGAAWTEHYFPSSDGSKTELHADVMLPEDLPAGTKVPVILSVGAYFGHSGQLAEEGWKTAGPSDRFQDLAEGGKLFDRGYALVQVDLRGFGGSTGCLDFMGKGEQADVKAAVDWAASQSWSTGAVGMYGKSYDAITGLVGNNLGPDGLEAVVAQEPAWDMYDLVRSNRVAKLSGVLAPNTYNQIAQLPQLSDDTERYRKNAAYEQQHPECVAYNTDNNLSSDPESKYWRQRDLAEQAKGSDTPLFVTQGFIESNTKPESMQEYLDNHEGVERGWLGQWDHVRGNERDQDGRLQMGRQGWFEEVMSFYDEHLKGTEPTTHHPSFAVQDSHGAWRAQDTWPARTVSDEVALRDGSYVDSGAPGRKQSHTTWSEPVPADVRLTGTPRLHLTNDGVGNLMVKLYDVAPDGSSVMFDEQVSLVDTAGKLSLDLKSTDWTLPKGHSLAVEIGTIYDGAWVDTPTGSRITTTDARLTLAVEDPADDTPTAGKKAPYLDTYRQIYAKDLTPGTPTFTVPTPDR
ncbi:hypothetical protein FB381_3573 [Nocardioides albertanoniae]|uniref:Xaa-Pro dipeptidyl-peptidase C-terminal domain-containing protein n=1 Tax=Nocardioides albertanoniae TaxID=1175486 RepID=A0A543AAN6_9ACTN|nr:CocE/NonD family hydrolase [Nocardioides albertanoniae]TQL69661.1 hypothetical protein FB381_3573 [Nocardioides albertanoniae]